jgi:hypothetical protein
VGSEMCIRDSTSFVIDTDVTLNLSRKRLVWTGGVDYPTNKIVTVEFQKPLRYIVLDDLLPPRLAGTFDGIGTEAMGYGEGPRVVRLKLADGWEREHNHKA